MEYDVAIVGGGPAGTTAAKVAAEKGLDVILFEKRNEIGAPKRCGEGLSMQAMNEANLKPSSEWALQEIDGMFLCAPSGDRVTVRYKGTAGYTIERKMFDKYLAIKAAEAGAKVMAGSRAFDLLTSGGKISGVAISSQNTTKSIKAKIVIAADGVESLVARKAGIDTTMKLDDICAAAQFEMSGIDIEDPKMLEVYMGTKIAPGGYIWVFPKGEKTANIGIGIKHGEKLAIDYLNDFVNAHPNFSKGSIIEVNAGGVPFGAPLKELTLDNFMIIGDAARQVNPVHGGGIGEAMTAGRMAAETAADAIKADDTSNTTLKKYTETWHETQGVKLAKLLKLRKVFDALKDDEMNYLAGALSGEDMLALTGATGFKKLAEIFAKNPRMIRLVPKILGL